LNSAKKVVLQISMVKQEHFAIKLTNISNNYTYIAHTQEHITY